MRLPVLLLLGVTIAAGVTVNPCKPGFYSTTGTDVAGPCMAADVGYAVSNAKATSERECVPGTYQPLKGKAFCRRCPPGCPAGTVPVNGAKACAVPPTLIPNVLALSNQEAFALAVDGANVPWLWGTSYMLPEVFDGVSIFVPTTIKEPQLLSTVSLLLGLTNLQTFTGVTQVAAGDEYGCVLYTSGSAACFGYVPLYGNSQTLSGQLVISDVVVTNIKQVAASTYGVALLRDHDGLTGTVTVLTNTPAAFPSSLFTSAGDLIDPASTTTPPAALAGAIAIGAGIYQVCALMGPAYTGEPGGAIGYVVCVGEGTGELGLINNLDPTYGPALISLDGSTLLSGVTSLSVGRSHVCAVKGLNVYCFGDNSYGQLAGVSLGRRRAEVKKEKKNAIRHATSGSSVGNVGTVTFTTDDVTSVHAVAAGAYHTCVLVDSVASGKGAVRCWGADGTNGQYAGSDWGIANDIPFSNTNTVPVTGVTSISAGYFATCATIGSNEAVTCWGDDTDGQLGDSGTAQWAFFHPYSSGPFTGNTTFGQLLPAGVPTGFQGTINS